jgi:transposase
MRIFERAISGRRYRILAVSERVPGKKNPVSRQVSLGPVEDEEPVVPARCVVVGERRVGDVGALIEVAEELGVLSAFAGAAPRQGDGPSLGEMVLAVALQRVCAPKAKVHLPEFLGSCLPRFTVQPPESMTGRAFYQATRKVSEELYDRVQVKLATRACQLFGLKSDVLAYDTTNFDTFIATTTEAALAQRGHAKSKRADLKVVGLALMTSATGSVPLFHRTYAGNESDKTVLAKTLGVLAQLHQELGAGDRTLVRDGGFAGEQLELDLGNSGYHSVTVLPLSSTTARQVLADAVGQLTSLPGKLAHIGAFRTRVKIGDSDRTLVVIESPELLEGQLRGMSVAEQKAIRELNRLVDRTKAQAAGTARGQRCTQTSLQRQIEALTSREHLSEFLRVEIGGDERNPSLAFTVDGEARARLVQERLGKRVLVTDQHEWSTECIVRAFRSQWHVERAFRRMKRGAVSVWGPSYQWTDDSIRAHTFATVLGLMLATLARHKLAQAGIHLPTGRTLALLRDIKLTHLVARGEGRGGPRDVFVPPPLDEVGRRAVAVFRLDRWTGLFSTTKKAQPRPRNDSASGGDAVAQAGK